MPEQIAAGGNQLTFIFMLYQDLFYTYFLRLLKCIELSK